MDPREFMFVQSTTEIGGAETVLVNAFSASAELRRRSLVVTLGFGHGDLALRLRRAGVEVAEIEGGRLRRPLHVGKTVRQLRKLVRECGVRIVIGNGTHPQVYVSLLSMVTAVRSVYFLHEIYRKPMWKNGVIRMLAASGPCDLILANSRASMAAISRLRPGVQVRLLYPGVPAIASAPADAHRRRAELGADDDDVLFGVFGRLQRGKGQDVFVQAATLVSEQLPRARFVIVGDSVFGLEPEFKDELRARVNQLGVGPRFVLTGFRSDVSELMAGCDVLCHPSRIADSFGMVIVEGMVQGRPVIAADGGGPSEIIQDGVDGRLVPPGDSERLAAAMVDLGRDPLLRRSMGEAGRAKATASFSSSLMAERLLKSLEELR
jgi:glycosyltransferase involved in cell wall biosynthesis